MVYAASQQSPLSRAGHREWGPFGVEGDAFCAGGFGLELMIASH